MVWLMWAVYDRGQYGIVVNLGSLCIYRRALVGNVTESSVIVCQVKKEKKT